MYTPLSRPWFALDIFPLKTKLNWWFNLIQVKTIQAEQRDMVLKSHRSHFWQIAVSCNFHSHDVQPTHHPMHDIFLVLECSISIKIGGKKSSFYFVNRKKKYIVETFLTKTIEEEKLPALPSQSLPPPSPRETAGSAWNQLRRKAGSNISYLEKFIAMFFLFVLQGPVKLPN